MRHLAALIIRLYQWTVSPLLGPACRFHPSCSQYALEAVLRFGVLRGSALAVKRLARCCAASWASDTCAWRNSASFRVIATSTIPGAAANRTGASVSR